MGSGTQRGATPEFLRPPRGPVSVRSSISDAKTLLITVIPGLQVTFVQSLPALNVLYVYKKGPTFHHGRRSSQIPPVGDLEEKRTQTDTTSHTEAALACVRSPRATADLP